MSIYPYAVAAVLFVAGLTGAVNSRSYIHLGLCLSVMQSSTYVLLLALGYRRAAAPPVVYGEPRPPLLSDPVVQALTVTDIVVGVVVLALIVSLALRTQERAGTVDPEKMRRTRG